jgi:hypothetical protein
MRPRRIAWFDRWGRSGVFHFHGEALIFDLARSVLSLRQPAVPPPAPIAHLILWRATADEDGHYCFVVAL